MSTSKEPLNIRNNNPGNLRFVGQEGASQGEGGFARFDNPQAGLDAMRAQIELDTQTRGLNLSQFLNKYAPPSENKTSNYIDFVVRKTGLDPNAAVPASAIPQLQTAMIEMEGGPRSLNYFQKTQVASAPATRTTEQAPRTTVQSPKQTGVQVAAAFNPGQLPSSYTSALALNYLADTDPEGVTMGKVNEMLSEMMEDGGGAAKPAGGKVLQQFAQSKTVDPFQFVLQKEEEPKRRAVPRMPKMFAMGGPVEEESGTQAVEVDGYKDGGDVDYNQAAEQMTVGTIPTEGQIPAGQALQNVGRDIVRGAQYLPYDLVGAPVDIINLGLTPFGLGSEKPFMGSEYLIDKAAQAGIADRPTGSAAETVTRIGMGFVNPAAVARQIPKGIAALERGAKAAELPGFTQTPPVGALFPKQPVTDRSMLLPKENKPFIGEVERIVADLPGPVTKEQFLGQIRKQGRNYEIARVEQALYGWDGDAKFTPADLLQRLQATSPSRYTTEIIPPGQKYIYDTMDNPFPSIRPGAVNLLLDLNPEQAGIADVQQRLIDAKEILSPYNFSPGYIIGKTEKISPINKAEEILPAIKEAAELTGKNPDKFIIPLRQIAEGMEIGKELRIAKEKIAYPALTDTWKKYTNLAVDTKLPPDLVTEYGGLDMYKLIAKIYGEGIEDIRKVQGKLTGDFKLSTRQIDRLADMAKKVQEGDESVYSAMRKQAENVDTDISVPLREGFNALEKRLDRYRSKLEELSGELPVTYYEGTHRPIAYKNPISFSRFVEFTPNQADEIGISMPDQDRGAVMFLELQSDRQKALRLNREVEEAFPNMGNLPQVTQQLMIKNAIYGGIKMDKGLVLFPGSDSAQAQLYEKLGPNLKQVVKDLGPGFRAQEFKFPNEKGEMATRWGVYIDEDAAKRVLTQGMRFAKGGMVDKPLYDRAQ